MLLNSSLNKILTIAKMTRFVFILLLLASCSLFGQKDRNIWYLGQFAGVDFNTSVPTALLNSSMSAREGSSSIADSNGNLLFYTNGLNVWNRNHLIMTNGSLNAADQLSCQPALIIKLPESDSIYYIFTTTNWNSFDGAYYSIVDMSMEGGLGAVVEKKKTINYRAKEQVVAVYHKNCRDVWVIFHEKGNNTFLSYLFTPSGISSSPTASSLGMQYVGNNRFGNLKASNNGKQICSTLGGISGTTVELYNFDNVTGSITNVLPISNEYNAYSAEFSPNDSVLYITGVSETFVHQYDLSSRDSNLIASSKFDVGVSSSPKTCLQIGPDRKIYVSKFFSNYLGVIENPNELGQLCNYKDSGIYLGVDRYAPYGMPNFPKGNLFFNYFNDTSSCMGDTVVLDAKDLGTSYLWQDSSTNSSFKVVENGRYSVTSLKSSCISTTIYDVIFIKPPEVQLGNDTTICQSTQYTINAKNPNSTYLWHDGSKNDTYQVNQSGLYSVIVTKDNCSSSDSISIEVDDCRQVLELPNIFTPNNDGLNDFFAPILSVGIVILKIEIYNRWGDMIYFSKDSEINWDGKNRNTETVSEGVYYWIVSYANLDGRKSEKKGTVTILK